MNWYIIAQYHDDIKQLEHSLEAKYPGLDLELWESNNGWIELAVIELPKDMRNFGYGTEIVNAVKAYAAQKGLPVILHPNSEKGKKEALEKFYRNLGFVFNRGRNTDFQLSHPFSPTMYWKPQ